MSFDSIICYITFEISIKYKYVSCIKIYEHPKRNCNLTFDESIEMLMRISHFTLLFYFSNIF